MLLTFVFAEVEAIVGSGTVAVRAHMIRASWPGNTRLSKRRVENGRNTQSATTPPIHLGVFATERKILELEGHHSTRIRTVLCHGN